MGSHNVTVVNTTVCGAPTSHSLFCEADERQMRIPLACRHFSKSIILLDEVTKRHYRWTLHSITVATTKLMTPVCNISDEGDSNSDRGVLIGAADVSLFPAAGPARLAVRSTIRRSRPPTVRHLETSLLGSFRCHTIPFVPSCTCDK